MAYDEKLAERVRKIFARRKGASERRMFGGVCYLLDGNMCCGIVGEDLMVRVGPEAYGAALEEPHARPMDFTGRPLRGLVYVAPAGHKTEAVLKKWIDRGIAGVREAPAKKQPKARKPAARSQRSAR